MIIDTSTAPALAVEVLSLIHRDTPSHFSNPAFVVEISIEV
jgi:hypothetical protein